MYLLKINEWINPFHFLFRVKNYRHPVMDGSHYFIGIRGDYGKGAYFFTRGILPFASETGHSKRFPVFKFHPVRNLSSGSSSPFVKAVSQDQASSSLKRTAESRFFFQGFGTGVDQAVSYLLDLGPWGE